MHSVGQFKTALPEQVAAFDAITAAALEKDKKLYETSAAAVQPVQHTIKIEPAKD
jgi:hypothetical protein